MQVLPPLDTARSPRAGGFTAVEIIITFVILGLATALIAPALLPPAAANADGVEGVIDAARRAAIARAEPLTLSLAADGRWTLEGRNLSLREGSVGWHGPGSFRLHISPLGACTVDAAQARVLIDPVRCTLRE